jgi:formylglycine-generating enzyme required for sulfatase activity
MNGDKDTSNAFFVVGGTLGGNATSYIQRPLDRELLRLTLAGEYCNVLAARQMGKSSLMVRTAQKLREHGVHPIIIDITAIGSSVSAAEWYFGLVSRLARELNLDIDEQDWWRSAGEKSPVQRLSDFLRDVVLEQIHEPVVVFMDEIDSTLKLDFTDDFFAAIRAMYNARSRDEVYKRLTFILLGVARPGDLIKDRTRTPYNIGINVDVTDFQIDELGSFRRVLDESFPDRGRDILQWVLDWTGGQPYLTQKLCSEIMESREESVSKSNIDSLVEAIFLSDQARTETNLRAIRDRIQNSPYLIEMLGVYKRVLAGKRIAAEERSIAQNELKLTGLLRVSPQGILQVRNQIYARIFDASWAKNSIPASVSNRRLVAAISSIAVVAIALAGFFYYRQVNQAIEIQAETYVDNFNNSSSQEVRISNLAGLFGLGGGYEEQALALFQSLNYEDQLALFDLATPDNVGDGLVTVVNGVYQSMQDTTNGNALLTAMANTLEGTNASGAVGLVIEINAWVDGRKAAAQGQYEVAVASLTTAWDRSEQRGNLNPSALLDRAQAYIALKQYDDALKDLEIVATQNQEDQVEIQHLVFGDEALLSYFRENYERYPEIVNIISIPTPAMTATPVPSVGIGTSKVSPVDGMTLLYVPEGEFSMGSEGSYSNESPVRNVYLDAYWIDKTEVTNYMYTMCVNDMKCNIPFKSEQHPNDYYGNSEYDNFPVVYVAWDDANKYCKWAGRRLPTEAEWEKAASWNEIKMEKYVYPWGNEPSCEGINLCGKNIDQVGSFQNDSSPYGILDMGGNVDEWVFDWFYLYEVLPTVNPVASTPRQYRILRGGTYNSDGVPTTFRNWVNPLSSNGGTGFRCAQDAP